MRNFILFFALLSAICVGGCTHVTERYSPSADNVATLRNLNKKTVNVGRFSTANGIAETEVPCAAFVITPSDKSSFTEYIRSALIAELKMAGVYSSTAPITITGTLEELSLDASAFSLSGEWFFQLTIAPGGKSFEVSEHYRFRSQTMNMTACEGSTRKFPEAVQNLIGKIINAPEFAMMVSADPS